MPVSSITKAALKVFGEGGGFESMMEAAQQTTSKDNAIHMKIFGGKDVNIIPSRNGALLQVSGIIGINNNGPAISMNNQDYKKFLSFDDYHKRMFVEQYLEQHAPMTYKMLKMSEMGDLNSRTKTHTSYTSDGIGIRYPEDQRREALMEKLSFKRYPDEPLNSRLSDVKMMNVRDGRGELHMKVDGQEQKFTISGDTFRAWGACALPTNVLANHVLELSEKQQMDLQTRVELGLDEQRDQGQSQSVGMRR